MGQKDVSASQSYTFHNSNGSGLFNLGGPLAFHLELTRGVDHEGQKTIRTLSHELACVCIGRGGFFFKKGRKGEHGAERERERERRDLNALHTPHPPPLQ